MHDTASCELFDLIIGNVDLLSVATCMGCFLAVPKKRWSIKVFFNNLNFKINNNLIWYST